MIRLQNKRKFENNALSIANPLTNNSGHSIKTQFCKFGLQSGAAKTQNGIEGADYKIRTQLTMLRT